LGAYFFVLCGFTDLLAKCTQHSCLYNSTVTIYDPFKQKVLDILTFPGITRNPANHLGGVAVNPTNGHLTILVDAAAAFNTFGADISGTNWLLSYDLTRHRIDFQLNLTKTSQGKYGGPQDVEHDLQGNIYVVGSFPSSILRVSPGGTKVVPWYLPETTDRVFGTAGLARTGNVLLANDNSQNAILRFNTLAAKGVPTLVNITPAGTSVSGSDAIYLPPKYLGTVLLVAVDATGIVVLRSRDGWHNAQYLGTVPNTGGGFATAAVQIGQSLYINNEFFDTATTPYGAGDRSVFPLVDITAEVEALLAA
jgi:hypothetical protein